MLEEHEKCVVRTYLQWLNDSSYDASCLICNESLDSDTPVLRLLCYDVFHTQCLLRYLVQSPQYGVCPTCNADILPSEKQMSPVAIALKQALSRSGLIEYNSVVQIGDIANERADSNASRLRDTSIAVHEQPTGIRSPIEPQADEKYKKYSIMEFIRRFIRRQTIVKPKRRSVVPRSVRILTYSFLVALFIFTCLSILERLSRYHKQT